MTAAVSVGDREASIAHLLTGRRYCKKPQFPLSAELNLVRNTAAAAAAKFHFIRASCYSRRVFVEASEAIFAVQLALERYGRQMVGSVVACGLAAKAVLDPG